jgi:hypothetical protein
MEQVRWAAAIRRTEPGNRQAISRKSLEDGRPIVLAPGCLLNVPNLNEFRIVTKVIDVPAGLPTRRCRRFPVMFQPAGKATRSQSAAYIDVESDRIR